MYYRVTAHYSAIDVAKRANFSSQVSNVDIDVEVRNRFLASSETGHIKFNLCLLQ